MAKSLHTGRDEMKSVSINTAVSVVIDAKRTCQFILRQIFSTIIPIPLIPPQMMKFQLAPCHKPPKTCVMKEFKFA